MRSPTRPKAPEAVAVPGIRPSLRRPRDPIGEGLPPGVVRKQYLCEARTHFLDPGGILYITELHPIVNVFDDEVTEPILRLRYPYWTPTRPMKFENIGSYADRTKRVTVPHEYDWSHSLGEIVTAIADAGLSIEFLHEFDFVEWSIPPLVERDGDVWRMPPGRFGDPEGQLPLSFSLRASKPG